MAHGMIISTEFASSAEAKYYLDEHRYEPDHRIGLALARTFTALEVRLPVPKEAAQ
jgi:hypothetical protein